MARKKKPLVVDVDAKEGRRTSGRHSKANQHDSAKEDPGPAKRRRSDVPNLKEPSESESLSAEASVGGSEGATESDASGGQRQGNQKRPAAKKRDRKRGGKGRTGASSGRSRQRSRSHAKEVNYQDPESSVGTDDFGELESEEDVGSDSEAESAEELVTVGNVQVPSLLLGDLVSSYLVLRAYSWQLKLSPFSLESFVEAVVVEQPNKLIDQVHVCLMRALVVDEGKLERQERVLDLAHLDFLTWPSFVWEWLVSEGYSFKTVEDDDDDDGDGKGVDEMAQAEKKYGKQNGKQKGANAGGGRGSRGKKYATRTGDAMDEAMDPATAGTTTTTTTTTTATTTAKAGGTAAATTADNTDALRQLFGKSALTSAKTSDQPEYHNLSLDIKVSVLQTLCDSLLDRPFVRAEIDRREEGGEVVTGIGGKHGQFAMMTQEEMEEANNKAKEEGQTDIFAENCVLCGLGGMLMCCDSCPAAYHAKCAGEMDGYTQPSKSQPWRCPECLAGGRGESAGLRLAVAGRPAGSRSRVYTFNGAVLCSHAAPVVGKGAKATEQSENCSVRVLHGADAEQMVNKMRLPKKQRLDPSSLAEVREGALRAWDAKSLPDGIHSYVNKYEWGWISTSAALRSHVEDIKKRRGNERLWTPHGTVAKAAVAELPAPLDISLYEWAPLRTPGNQGVSTLRCGKCFSCLRPNLKKPCMDPVKKSAEDAPSRLGYVSALLSKMERDFWPLAEKQWTGTDGGHMHRNKWIAGVREATSPERLAELMLQFEAALRPTCFRAHWYKYYPSSLMPGGVNDEGYAGGPDDPEDGPVDANDTSRARDQYDIGSDMGIAEFSKSQGEWEEKKSDNAAAPSGSKRLGPPKFLVRQAVLNAGRKPIPGVKYSKGVWKMNNERLKWISEVEGCKTVSDLALAIRKLEGALRWDSATRPRFVVDDVSIRGKRVADDGVVEYALFKAKAKNDDGQDGEADDNAPEAEAEEDDDPDAVPASAVWVAETSIPLWVMKGYEEQQRRQSIRESIQAMHMAPGSLEDSDDEKRPAPAAVLCGHCLNQNSSNAKSPFTPKCKVCLRQFHGLCVFMTDDEVQAATAAAQATPANPATPAAANTANTSNTTNNASNGDDGGWTCAGCKVNEKLIARLAKSGRVNQHLPGTAFSSGSTGKWKALGKKAPGRPAKPFYERTDYCITERRELQRRLKAAERPELFGIDADDQFNPAGTSLVSFGEMDVDGKNPTKCTVCRYPDLGRPLIPCSGCSREFHAECFGINSSLEPHHWNAKTIKCAECLGKRVRAPAEAVILAAIEAAQEPNEEAASIQDRVKQRSRHARQAKEAQVAEDAKRANWMQAADNALTRIYRMQVAEAFRFPVPTDILTDYTNYVEHPMDLGTIRDELYSYESPFDVVKNMRLIVDNCVAYNGHDAKVTGQAHHMMKSFMRIWQKEGLPLPGDDIAPDLLARVGGAEQETAPPEEDDAPYLRVAHLLEGEPANDWMRRIGKVFGQLSKLQCVVAFLRPVPKDYDNGNYHRMIRRPMDFSTIKSKLNDGKYVNPSQVLLDVDLIWQNCLTWNRPDAPVVQDLRESREEFERLWVAGNVMVPVGDGVIIKNDDGSQEAGPEWMEPARSVLYRLLNFVPQASWFYEPVVEADFPDYRNIVETPICLRQISEQLNAGKYATTSELWADVELIIRNSEAYNGPDHQLTEGARLVFSAFKKYWKNLNLAHPSDDGSLDAFFATEWISSSLACIDGVLEHPLADPFAAPVSERAAPGYSKVVKRPMDFSTIKYNLEKGSYQSALQVAEDVSLIFQNCRAYNPAGDEVRATGTMVEAMIRSKWENAELPFPKKWRKR